MPETLVGIDPLRLGRSCDAIRLGASAPGIELAAARFVRTAYEPHRHDTYAIGITTAGAQAFRYRGAGRVCRAGELHILHPDVLHDGAPATPDGFAYRIVYVEPALVRDALGGAPLPFVAEPVAPPSPLTAPVAALLADIDEPLDDLRRTTVVTAIADLLKALGARPCARGYLDAAGVERARDYLVAHACDQVGARDLERISGLDRFTLARQFRRAFGTSPDRYRTMRRLAVARRLIRAGTPLAAVAAEAGFADQSHLTRQFKRAYGITPGRFARIATAGERDASATGAGHTPVVASLGCD